MTTARTNQVQARQARNQETIIKRINTQKKHSKNSAKKASVSAASSLTTWPMIKIPHIRARIREERSFQASTTYTPPIFSRKCPALRADSQIFMADSHISYDLKRFSVFHDIKCAYYALKAQSKYEHSQHSQQVSLL